MHTENIWTNFRDRAFLYFPQWQEAGGNDFCPTCLCTPEEGQAQHCGGSSWPLSRAAHWWLGCRALHVQQRNPTSGNYYRMCRGKGSLDWVALQVHYKNWSHIFTRGWGQKTQKSSGPGQRGPGCQETAARAAPDWSVLLILSPDWLARLSRARWLERALTRCFSPQ